MFVCQTEVNTQMVKASQIRSFADFGAHRSPDINYSAHALASFSANGQPKLNHTAAPRDSVLAAGENSQKSTGC